MAEPARAATVLMEPELCAAMHHVICDFDEDCFSETSLDFPDFLENEFQDRVLEEPVVGRDHIRGCPFVKVPGCACSQQRVLVCQQVTTLELRM